MNLTVKCAKEILSNAEYVHLKLGTSLKEIEKIMILKTLEAMNGNKNRTAFILEISVRTLRSKLRSYACTQQR